LNSKNFSLSLSLKKDLVFCDYVCSVIEVLGHQHVPTEWRFLIQLLAVLLHEGNKFPSAPLVHTANMNKPYENIKLLLEKIQYEKYNWNICWYLK
jgi:hypothetical protein